MRDQSFSTTGEQKLLNSLSKPINPYNTKIKDFNIHYVHGGSGNPILFIHGANIGWGQWYSNISEISQYHEVFGIDLPGSGGSTKINFTKSHLQNDFVQTVIEFIKFSKHSKINIVGHSFGAWIAIQVYFRNKNLIDKLILVNPLGFDDYLPNQFKPISILPLANLLSKTVVSPSWKNMKNFLGSVMYNPDSLETEFLDYFHESVLREKKTHPFMFINRMSDFLKIKKEINLNEVLSEINCPTMILAGKKDPLILLDKNMESFKQVPLAFIEVFENSGHVLPIEENYLFNQKIINFLRH